MIELDPREQKRREQFGEPPPLPVTDATTGKSGRS
ncbi:Uncharacterised protein [Enterobacter cloacae]|uniref:Uncharacterized protein n=1 Tax=Enterobacter cloacae TaxID=550 RepID=A0A377MA54_ENTCL|nr:Uncharacterised protein [Enterobacter cloacae]